MKKGGQIGCPPFLLRDLVRKAARGGEKMAEIRLFEASMQEQVTRFFAVCLPASGRTFQPEGRHRPLTELCAHYRGKDRCWCLLEGEEIVGTVAVRELTEKRCELKLLYVLPGRQKMGYGGTLFAQAERYAREQGCRMMMLDTTKESKAAIGFYRRRGFVEIGRYNDNAYADIFMEKVLDAPRRE